MPAAKLRPVGPSTTTTPPVMYSQPWSPTPSTTAAAPELRTANRSPTRPRRNSSPARRSVEDGVAGDDLVLGAVAAGRRRRERRRLVRPDHQHAHRTGPCRRSRWRRRAAAGVTPARDEGAERLADACRAGSPRSCRRAGPRRRARRTTSPPSMAPTLRFSLRTGRSRRDRRHRRPGPAPRAR